MQVLYTPRYADGKARRPGCRRSRPRRGQGGSRRPPSPGRQLPEQDGRKHVAPRRRRRGRDVCARRRGYRAPCVVSVAAGQRISQGASPERRGGGCHRPGPPVPLLLGEDEPRLTDVSPVAHEPSPRWSSSSAATRWPWARRAPVTSWFRAAMPSGGESHVKAHVFEPQGSAVVGFAVSRATAASAPRGGRIAGPAGIRRRSGRSRDSTAPAWPLGSSWRQG